MKSLLNSLLTVALLVYSSWCFPAYAASRISATVTITNAPTTNGMTFVLNGATRTWTNSVQNSATQILTNSAIGGIATNLYLHSLTAPFAGPVSVSRSSTNKVIYTGETDQAMVISFTGNYASVAYTTQTVSTAVAVRIPITIETAAQQTNISSGLVAGINLSAQTNSINQYSTAASQLVGLTNAQTIAGIKLATNFNNQIGGRRKSKSRWKSWSLARRLRCGHKAGSSCLTSPSPHFQE